MAWPNTVRKSDLKIEYMRGSGAGGQNRNKRDTACRMTHIPTGISVRAEDERTQEANKRLAFKRLTDKLVPLMKAAVSSGIVKEKQEDEIRVYREIDDKVRDTRTDKQFSYRKIVDGKGLDDIHKEIRGVE